MTKNYDPTELQKIVKQDKKKFMFIYCSDQTPPLKDCSEVYRMGARAPGWYNLDPSGNMKNNDDVFYCEDGWTYIMQRQPKSVQLRGSVRKG